MQKNFYVNHFATQGIPQILKIYSEGNIDWGKKIKQIKKALLTCDITVGQGQILIKTL